MERKKESEKFQPRILASFTKTQIQSIETWVRNSVVPTEGWSYLQTFNRVLRSAEVDEKGKLMDEKSRIRIKYGMLVISELHRRKQDLDLVQGAVVVWQTRPGKDNLSVRFEVKESWRNPRYNRY